MNQDLDLKFATPILPAKERELVEKHEAKENKGFPMEKSDEEVLFISKLRREAEESRFSYEKIQETFGHFRNESNKKINEMQARIDDLDNHYKMSLSISKAYETELNIYKELYSQLIEKVLGR